MKSKLAIWSWILPIIGLILYIVIVTISSGMRVDAGVGSPITSPERTLALVFSVIFLIIVITGLIIGIISLRKIENNPKLTGRGHATVGIIINGFLFIFGFLMLGSALIGG